MARIVVGLFDRFSAAEDAIRELEKSGIERNNISIVANDAQGEYARLAGSGAAHLVAGAGTGAAIGGVAGLILGLAALAIPGVGPIVAAGPLAATLGSAGVGAAAGGLIGALTALNIPEGEARYYADAIREGGALVLVKAADAEADRVRDILNRNGARNGEERMTEWRNQGGAGHEMENEQLSRPPRPSPPQMTSSGARVYVDGLEMEPRKSRFEDFENAYRSNFEQRFKNSGYNYEQFSPAYRYGYSLALEVRYRGKQWADIEPDAERDWEDRNPGTWNQVKDAVQHAWEHGMKQDLPALGGTGFSL